MMAFSGVRSSWLMLARKTAPALSVGLRLGAGDLGGFQTGVKVGEGVARRWRDRRRLGAVGQVDVELLGRSVTQDGGQASCPGALEQDEQAGRARR